MNKKDGTLIKSEIMRSFNNAVATYDEAAFLQREVADRLLERLDYIRIRPKIIVDLGAGTGYCSKHLEQRYKKAKILTFDLSEHMLLQSKRNKKWFDRKRYICGDAENLPFASQSVDLLVSNLMLHWCNRIDKAIFEMQRVLKPNGVLLFSTLGPDTLYELRESWANTDSGVHVHTFTDMHFIGDYLQKAQFDDPVVDMEFITVTYNDLRRILIDLKNLGTQNIAKNRLKGLTGKTKFKKFTDAYEKFRNDEGLIPVTYEIIYGHAWGAKKANSKQEAEIAIPVSSITRRQK